MKFTEAPSVEKKQQLERLLGLGTVMVFIDTRRAGVNVPPEHLGNPRLPLNFDYGFEIPGFQIFDDHIEASLSFSGRRHHCILPFHAVYGFMSQTVQEGVFFTEDVPSDLILLDMKTREEEPPLLKVMQPQELPSSLPGEKDKKPIQKRHLKLIKSE